MSATVFRTGDVVRVYGFPGTFVIHPDEPKYYDFYGERNGAVIGFMFSSVVELNGAPLPLRSCPIDFPADDYPHEPTFDYTDGPQERAAECVKHWRKQKEAAAV